MTFVIFNTCSVAATVAADLWSPQNHVIFQGKDLRFLLKNVRYILKRTLAPGLRAQAVAAQQ